MKDTKNKILIVEDDFFILKVATGRFDSEGIEYEVAKNGEEALEKIIKNDYSLILMDIIMPKLTGVDVLKEMKKNGKNTPVIIFSNMTQEDISKDLEGINFVGYFLKANHTIDEMIDLIKATLNSNQ